MDPKLPFHSKKCQCSACGLYFKAPYAFDIHRVGVGRDRRCLAPIEMSERGFVESPSGHWYKKNDWPNRQPGRDNADPVTS